MGVGATFWGLAITMMATLAVFVEPRHLIGGLNISAKLSVLFVSAVCRAWTWEGTGECQRWAKACFRTTWV